MKITDTGNIKLTREEYNQLHAKAQKSDELQSEVNKLRQVWSHWKGVIMLMFETAPDEVFDEGMSRRIKGKV